MLLCRQRGFYVKMDDGWTVRTTGGPPSAHAEHAIAMTRGAPIVLTG
jgi:hypothetical protein